MDINPQFTFDKDSNAIGVFISIEEWIELTQTYNSGCRNSKGCMDAEIAAINAYPDYLVKWENVKK